MGIYDDPKVYDQSIPFIERRKYVLTKRVAQFIHWITVAEYEDKSSPDFLINRTNQIIDALNQSISPEQWKPFEESILACIDRLNVDTSTIDDYSQVQRDIIELLKGYMNIIQQLH